MSELKFTPGPWLMKREGFSTVYIEARIGGGMVQEVAACGPTEYYFQQEANARLIEQAPRMLEVLKKAQDALYTCDQGDTSTGTVIAPSFDQEAVQAAISEIFDVYYAATGESP